MTNEPVAPYTYKYIENTGLTIDEVNARAEQFLARAAARDLEGIWTMQEAIDGVIDAASEYAQGEVK